MDDLDRLRAELLFDELALPPLRDIDASRTPFHEAGHVSAALLLGFAAEASTEADPDRDRAGWTKVLDRSEQGFVGGGPPDGQLWDAYAEARAVVSLVGAFVQNGLPERGRGDIENAVAWRRSCTPDARAGFTGRVIERVREMVKSSEFKALQAAIARELARRGRLTAAEVDQIAAEVGVPVLQ